MRTRSTRIRLAAITAATLALVAFAPTAAQAETGVTFTVYVGNAEILSEVNSEAAPQRPGVLEVYDAASDGTTPLYTVPFLTNSGTPDFLTAATVDVALPDGAYKVRVVADGLQPAWFDGAGNDQLFGYTSFFGFNPISDFTSASTVAVPDVDSSGHRYVMLHSSSSSVVGIVLSIDESGAEAEAPVGTVDLFAIGAATALKSVPVGDATLPAYEFTDVPAGSYLMRFHSTFADQPGGPASLHEQWWPYAPTRSQAQPITITGAGGHYVALDATFGVLEGNIGNAEATIVGESRVGQSLTLTPGQFDFGNEPGPISDQFLRSIQWFANGVPIVGATTSTLIVPASAQGAVLSVTAELYTLLGIGHASIDVSTAGPVLSSLLPQLSGDLPTIVGEPTIGTALTSTIGTWPGGVAKDFQWSRNGVPIPGATLRTYKPTGEDSGAVLTFTVTGTKAGFAVTPRTSAPTAPVAPAPVLVRTSVPRIQGGSANVKVGDVLTVNPGTWKPTPVEFAYQWFRGGAPIAGATSTTYAATSGDVGETLTVAVTGSKLGYPSDTQTSAATGVVQGIIAWVKPVVVGAAKVGVTLTADVSTWVPASLDFSYQWSWIEAGITTDVPGATGSTYVPTINDKNHKLVVTVSAAKANYLPIAAKQSLATAKVVP